MSSSSSSSLSLSSSSSSSASTDASVSAPTSASAISSSSTSTTTSTITPDELEEIHKYLGTVNGPAVKTIIRDREIIDCIPKDKVTFYVKVEKIPEPSKIEIRLPLGCKIVAPQRLTADSPEGTVPRRRVTLEDVLRAGSLAKFGKKSPCSGLYFKRTMRGLAEGSKGD